MDLKAIPGYLDRMAQMYVQFIIDNSMLNDVCVHNIHLRDLLEMQDSLASLDLVEIMVSVGLLVEMVKKVPLALRDYEEKVDARVLQGSLVLLVLMDFLELMETLGKLDKRYIPICTLLYSLYILHEM